MSLNVDKRKRAITSISYLLLKAGNGFLQLGLGKILGDRAMAFLRRAYHQIRIRFPETSGRRLSPCLLSSSSPSWDHKEDGPKSQVWKLVKHGIVFSREELNLRSDFISDGRLFPLKADIYPWQRIAILYIASSNASMTYYLVFFRLA